MALKIYAIHGRSTAILRIPAGDGKAYLECEFTNGRPAKGANYRPATFSTTDKTAQMIIEKSPYFGKSIKLQSVYGVDNKTKAVAKTADAPAPVKAKKPVIEGENAGKNAKIFPDVTTYEQAIQALKSLGAKATQLRGVPAIQKTMVTLGVEFPNYKF